MSDHQYGDSNTNSCYNLNTHQHEPATRRCPSPFLAERYLAAIQTNGSGSGSGNATDLKTSSSNNHSNDSNINTNPSTSMKRPRPIIGNLIGRGYSFMNNNIPPSSLSTTTTQTNTTGTTSNSPIPMPISTTPHQQDQYQFQTQSNLQSRNGSTSPSRGRLTRSESYQMRDSASAFEQDKITNDLGGIKGNSSSSNSSNLQNGEGRGGGEEEDYMTWQDGEFRRGQESQSQHPQRQLQQKNQNQNQMYHRQWTPNQWRNFRTIQQEEKLNQLQQQQQQQEEEARSYNHDSVNKVVKVSNGRTVSPKTVNADDNDSVTETDVVTNKSFDFSSKRRSWMNGSKTSNSNLVSAPWSTPKITLHDDNKKKHSQQLSQPQSQQQQKPVIKDEEDECDFTASEEASSGPRKPLHHVNGHSAAIRRRGPPDVSMKDTVSSPPMSPIKISSRKWQKKILNDRGWIKRNTDNGNSNSVRSENEREHERERDGGVTNEKFDVDSSSLASLTSWAGRKSVKYNEQSNNVKKIHQHPIHPNESKEAFTEQERKEVDKQPSSSSCNSLQSIPVKKITSMWIDRVNATAVRKRVGSGAQIQKATSRVQENENDSVLNDCDENYSLKSYHEPKTSHPPRKAQISNTLENTKNVYIPKGGEKNVWGGVKLRPVRKGKDNADTQHEEKLKMFDDQSAISTLAADDDATLDSIINEDDKKSIDGSIQSLKATLSVNDRIKVLSEKNRGGKYSTAKIHQASRMNSKLSLKERIPRVRNDLPQSQNQPLPTTVKYETVNSINFAPSAESHQAQYILDSRDKASGRDQHSLHSSDNTKQLTGSSDKTDFKSVRSKLRSWNEGRSIERSPLEVHRKKILSPDRSLQAKNKPLNEVHLNKDKIEIEPQDAVSSSDSDEVNKQTRHAQHEVSDWRTRNPRPSQIKKNRLGTFLKEPLQEVICDQNLSLKNNASPKYSSPLNRNKFHIRRKNTPTRRGDTNVDDFCTQTLDTKPSDVVDLDVDNKEEKKPTNISFEFTSVKQRIRSLVGDIENFRDDAVKTNNDTEIHSLEKTEEMLSNIENNDNDGKYLASINKSRLPSRRKGEYLHDKKKIMAGDDPNDLSPQRKNNGMVELRAECLEQVEDDDGTLGSKGVKGMKSLFESTKIRSPPSFGKSNNHKCVKQLAREEEVKVGMQVSATEHMGDVVDNETFEDAVGLDFENDITRNKGVMSMKSIFENRSPNALLQVQRINSRKEYSPRERKAIRSTYEIQQPDVKDKKDAQEEDCLVDEGSPRLGKKKSSFVASNNTVHGTKISVGLMRSRFELSSPPKSNSPKSSGFSPKKTSKIEWKKEESEHAKTSEKTEAVESVLPNRKKNNGLITTSPIKQAKQRADEQRDFTFKSNESVSVESKQGSIEKEGKSSEAQFRNNCQKFPMEGAKTQTKNKVLNHSHVESARNKVDDSGKSENLSIDLFPNPLDVQKPFASFQDDAQQLQNQNDLNPGNNFDYDRDLKTPTNEIEWEGNLPNDIPWSSSGQNHNDNELNFDAGNQINQPTYDDEEDCDGVTLSPTTSDVSSLSIPSCLHSVETSTEFESSSSSDEDTGAMESCTDKQSSAKGASEASSSHTSEAATPLIHSTLMTMTMSRLASHSDSSQSIDIKQITGLLGTIPPLKEDNSLEEGLLLQDSHIPSRSTMNSISNSQEGNVEFVPSWDGAFFDSPEHQWEDFSGYEEKDETSRQPIVKHQNESEDFKDGVLDTVDRNKSSAASVSNISSSSSRAPKSKKGFWSNQQSQIKKEDNRSMKDPEVKKPTMQLQPRRSKKFEKVKIRTVALKEKDSSTPTPRTFSHDERTPKNRGSSEDARTTEEYQLKSVSSDRENNAPYVTSKHIFKSAVNVKRSSSTTTTRRFDIQKVKAYQLARRKSFDRHKKSDSAK